MPKLLKIVLLVLVIAAAVVLLFTTVFPWVEQQLEQDPTLGVTITTAQELRSPR